MEGPPLTGHQSSEYYLIASRGGYIVHTSKSLQELCGEEISGRRCPEVLFKAQACCAECPYSSGALRRQFVTWHTGGASTLLRLEVICHPPFDLHGTGSHVPVILRDMTAQGARDDALLQRTQEITTLNEVSRTLSQALDPGAVVEKILAAVEVLIPGVVGQVWELSESGDTLGLVAMAGSRDGLEGFATRVPAQAGLVGAAIAARDAVTTSDARADPRVVNQQWMVAQEIESGIALPLVRGEQVLGALAVFARGGRHLTAEHSHLLRSFAAHAAVALDNARLHEALRNHAEALEARVRERTQELEATNQKLVVASRHKSEFLANMSHELRTPLNSILGFGRRLSRNGEQNFTPKQKRHLEYVLDSGEHLLQLINDILDLSKVEAGRMELLLEPLEIGPLLNGVAAIARGLALAKSQTLRVEVASSLPPVTADAVRLKQICYNLLSNAVKFTEEGGTITLSARRAPDTKGRAGQWLEISVADTGIGIPPEALPELFTAFTQVEPAATKEHEGTGLGLALTRQLVTLHGGRVAVTSSGAGQGSTFTVELPVNGPLAVNGTEFANEIARVGH